MKGKRIVNIVFYKFYDNDKEIRKACVFYSDGTVNNVTYEEGISACEEVVKTHHITSKEAFKEMINHNIIHVVSGRDLEKNFSNYIVNESLEDEHEAGLENRSNEDIPGMRMSEPVSFVNLDNHTENVQENGTDNEETVGSTAETADSNNNDNGLGFVPIAGVPTDTAETEHENEAEEVHEDEPVQRDEDDSLGVENGDSNNINNSTPETDEPLDSYFLDDLDEEEVRRPVADGNDADYDLNDDLDDDIIDEDIEDNVIEEENANERPAEERKGVLGFIKKQWEKLKKSKLVRRLVLGVTALAMGLGLYTCAAKNTKEGQMVNSNITKEASDDQDGLFGKLKNLTLTRGNNDRYDNYSYGQLLEVTENDTQKTAMTNLGNVIQAYNGSFADAYVEEGKDVRAALSFDELVALQQAYNDYNKDEIKAYFNGAEINAAEMEQDYKSASLQLMGAHVIETRENPVDMSDLLVGDEAKEFYAKYHEMFLAAKEAQGDDKLAKVNAFYKEVRADFPITQEVRTEGIMHADDYDSIESYKLSVTPMIAAAEMMFQNLNTDYTLNDSEIDFLNDIGLCNYAQDKFARIETITLSSEEDNKNPLYSQYRDSIIGMMKDKGQYVIDDEHRDLSRLDAFQNAVNWHFEESSEATWVGSTYTTTETHNETNTWTESNTTYREEETRTEKPIPQKEKEKIDKEIEKENKKEKEKAEKEAEETRKEMQQEADEDAKRVEEEVKQDAEDMQQDIDEANDRIDQNNADDNPANDVPVNEDDFGDHNVDFDDEHSDSEGNLDNSVENITTDPTGDQTGEELPDPNATGEKFDEQYNDNSSSGSSVEVDNSASQETTYIPDTSVDESTFVEQDAPAIPDTSVDEVNTSGQEVYEYEEPVSDVSYEESAVDVSNEELVDAYVESLAEDTYQEEESYQYTLSN